MKALKQIISITLCLLIFIATMSSGLSAVAVIDDGYVCGCNETPVIYIKGRTNIYKDVSLGTGSENMAETNFSGGTDAIIESAMNIIPAFAKALITDEWDDYCDVLFEEIIPIYEGYKLNNDGEKTADNPSGIASEWNLDNIIARYEEENVRYRHKGNTIYWAQFIAFCSSSLLSGFESQSIGTNGLPKRFGKKINLVCGIWLQIIQFKFCVNGFKIDDN